MDRCRRGRKDRQAPSSCRPDVGSVAGACGTPCRPVPFPTTGSTSWAGGRRRWPGSPGGCDGGTDGFRPISMRLVTRWSICGIALSISASRLLAPVASAGPVPRWVAWPSWMGYRRPTRSLTCVRTIPPAQSRHRGSAGTSGASPARRISSAQATDSPAAWSPRPTGWRPSFARSSPTSRGGGRSPGRTARRPDPCSSRSTPVRGW